MIEFAPFNSRSLFVRFLSPRDAHRKSHQLSPIVKMMERHTLTTGISVLHIGKGKKDNLGIIFHITPFKLYCDSSLELPHCDSSNVGSQHIFSLRNKKNYLCIILNTPSYLVLWYMPYLLCELLDGGGCIVVKLAGADLVGWSGLWTELVPTGCWLTCCREPYKLLSPWPWPSSPFKFIESVEWYIFALEFTFQHPFKRPLPIELAFVRVIWGLWEIPLSPVWE